MKLVVTEDDSELADELWASADRKIASHLVYPEARAALAAAWRAGRVDRSGLRRALADLEAATSSMWLIGVDEVIAHAAGRLAEEHSLRGYDAVHLATALAAGSDQLLVVTWDRDLAAAAVRCGHPVSPALATGDHHISGRGALPTQLSS